MMKRKLSQYANCTARAVSDGSPAQMFHFVEDAKHDIAELAKTNAKLIEELKGLVRILDAVKFSSGLGKTQLERLDSAKRFIGAAGDMAEVNGNG